MRFERRLREDVPLTSPMRGRLPCPNGPADKSRGGPQSDFRYSTRSAFCVSFKFSLKNSL
jgi:hypothetical protein